MPWTDDPVNIPVIILNHDVIDQYLYGRNAGYPAPPVQSRTYSFPVSGSSVVRASAVQSAVVMRTPSGVCPP